MKDDNVPPELVEKAKEALNNAYCPYSKFPVGAAVLTASGKIYAAPNIENASYGLSICAERNAIFHAISAGEHTISILLLYTPTDEVHTPCGACRQVVAEFLKGDAQVVCVADSGVTKAFTVDELLPAKFSL
jgi:cytidine deaminase